jgi:hypothetical protein
MIYLRKANDDLISHCRCTEADISAPGQMDCPWCGCGWLFTCSVCRKAFTLAEAVEVDFTLEEMARRDLQGYDPSNKAPSQERVQEWVDFMELMLRGIEVGHRYVYFDSYVLPTDADGVALEGLHSQHALAVVPQVEALRDRSIVDGLRLLRKEGSALAPSTPAQPVKIC